MKCGKIGAIDDDFIIICHNKILSTIWMPKTENSPQDNLAKILVRQILSHPSLIQLQNWHKHATWTTLELASSLSLRRPNSHCLEVFLGKLVSCQTTNPLGLVANLETTVKAIQYLSYEWQLRKRLWKTNLNFHLNPHLISLSFGRSCNSSPYFTHLENTSTATETKTYQSIMIHHSINIIESKIW